MRGENSLAEAMDESWSSTPGDMPYGSQLQMVGAKLPCFNDVQPSSIDPFEKRTPAADRLSPNASLPTQSLNQPTKNNWCRDGIYQAISQRNLEVLENAFAFSPKVTADQALFLGKSIKLEPEMIKQWFEHRRTKGPGFEIRSRRRAFRTIAQWKRKIIDQGLSAIQDPTRDQLDFLAAGLNLVYDQIRGLLAERDSSKKSSHSSSVFHDMIEVSPSFSIISSDSLIGSKLTVGTTVTDFSTCFTTPGSVAEVNGSWENQYPLMSIDDAFSKGPPVYDNMESADDLVLPFDDSDHCSDFPLFSKRPPHPALLCSITTLIKERTILMTPNLLSTIATSQFWPSRRENPAFQS